MSDFSEEEQAAMRETAAERKRAAAAKRAGKQVDGLADVLEKIAAMQPDEAAIATRVHELVLAAAPGLEPSTWYGMPAYKRKGKVVVFFQEASKFKARYCTLGFNDEAALDDGSMWPTSFALVDLDPQTERRITELVTRAVS